MKYKIWDRKEMLYTPSGAAFTAEDFIKTHAAWANIPGVKCVICDAPINCAIFMEFESMKNHYQSAGVEIVDGMSDQEVLDSITAFEQKPQAVGISVEERIAAALEFNNLLNM